MPWVNWHAGLGGGWGIRNFPTYVLIDEQGLVLDRTNGLYRLARFDPQGKAVEGTSAPQAGA